MALRPPRPPRDPRVMVAVAVTFGVIGLIALAIVVAVEVTRGERPEEDVAATFLEQLFAGQGEQAYELTTPRYRAVVFPADLDALADGLHGLAVDAELEVLGSERSPGVEPPESLVGYTGTSEVGRVEGVVTLREIDGEWLVEDVSYRFPDASAEQRDALTELTDRLNAQIEQRLRQGTD